VVQLSLTWFLSFEKATKDIANKIAFNIIGSDGGTCGVWRIISY
jgi:hypothetical protein